MKIISHISTGQYEFSEMQEDLEFETIMDAAKYAQALDEEHKNAFKEVPVNTMPEKEYTDFLAKMLKKEEYHIEDWEKMSVVQQRFCNLLKNAQKRN